MWRRMLPTSVALTLGFLLLAWGLVRLHQVFVQERAEARREVAARRDALGRYAERSLAHELEDSLRRAEPDIQHALADPLVAASHLLFIDRAPGDQGSIDNPKQRLPRLVTPRPGVATPGDELFNALRQGRAAELRAAVESDSPWAERLVLYERFAGAVDRQQGGEVADAFRAILSHRVRYRIARTLDLPYMLALLDLFASESRPDPALLRGLLHEGLSDGRGGRVRDLSRLVLESRDRFTATDFEILSGRLVRLAEGSGAPYEAFLARARETEGPVLALGDLGLSPLALSALVLNGSWYVAPVDGDGVSSSLQGIAVEFDTLLARIGGEMEELGLLSAGDEVLAGERVPTKSVATSLPASHVAIDALRLQVVSPTWGKALDDIEERYRLKTGLVALSALFALAIVTLALVLQHRRHQLLELKADFVATVSHELRTPLASVRLMSETLERRVGHLPAAKDYPSRIVREVDGLSFLVENILSFHRLEKGRWRIQPADVPLVELVDFLQSELELHMPKTVRVECEGDEDLSLRGDPELLKLLFLNLGRNACLYNHREPVVISLTVIDAKGSDAPGSDAPGSDAGVVRRLHFGDNGWGLDPAETGKVFTEFYRSQTMGAKQTAGVKGTGLGLAICRRVMALHGGEIRVADTSPEGTTFELGFKA